MGAKSSKTNFDRVVSEERIAQIQFLEPNYTFAKAAHNHMLFCEALKQQDLNDKEKTWNEALLDDLDQHFTLLLQSSAQIETDSIIELGSALKIIVENLKKNIRPEFLKKASQIVTIFPEGTF